MLPARKAKECASHSAQKATRLTAVIYRSHPADILNGTYTVMLSRQKIVKVCDMCGWEVDDLYQVEDQQICGECRDELFPKVKINRR